MIYTTLLMDTKFWVQGLPKPALKEFHSLGSPELFTPTPRRRFFDHFKGTIEMTKAPEPALQGDR